MQDRQEKLLEILIRSYIESAEPISSGFLAKLFNYRVSPATIRNDLALLEDHGYLTQPHISAGRLPTEKAYHFYLEHFFEDRPLNRRLANQLNVALQRSLASQSSAIKSLAKALAAISGQSIFVALSPDDLYLTGFTNLFAQPEFGISGLLEDLGVVFDQMEAGLANIYREVGDEVTIYLGKNNPFNRQCGMLMVKYQVPGLEYLLGMLGPIRMDYELNAALLNHVKQLTI